MEVQTPSPQYIIVFTTGWHVFHFEFPCINQKTATKKKQNKKEGLWKKGYDTVILEFSTHNSLQLECELEHTHTHPYIYKD